MQTRHKHGFNGKIKWILLLLLAMARVCTSFAQDKPGSKDGTIEGIVFDKDTKERIARIVILNINTGKTWYDDLKGEFKVDAQAGDKLVFTKEDYKPDTVAIKSNANIAVYMQRIAIMLREVTIRDSMHTPGQKLAATQKEFSRIYSPSMNPGVFSSIPGGGAGISLDAIYNSLSRSGRDAEHLRGLIQTDYQQNVIDFRFNKSYVANITKLKDKDLADFMIKYRPSYYLVTNDTEYEFITYIHTSLRRYLRNKRVFALPPLRPPQS